MADLTANNRLTDLMRGVGVPLLVLAMLAMMIVQLNNFVVLDDGNDSQH